MPNENLGMSDVISMQSNKDSRSPLTLRGFYHIELRGPDGAVKEVRNGENTVTTAGKAGACAQITTTSTVATWGFLAIGTGVPAATLLGAEATRVAFTSNISTGNNVCTAIATFLAGGTTGAFTEAGTFDIVTANTVNMWTASSFAAVNKGAADSLQVTWTLTYN